jgi:hypothetical protein
MRVYAEVLPRWLGRAMYRINRELRRYAPDGVEFVDDARAADLQILDVIGTGSLEYLRAAEYVLIQYCYLTTERPDGAYWSPIFRGARLVMSYHDLPSLTGDDAFRFYRAPLGVDGEVFRDRQLTRDAVVLTTGYDPGGEAIQECHDAVFGILGGRCGGMVHIGPAFWPGRRVEVAEGISDEQLAIRYGRCRYVSGLRRGEGFELPVIEGLACGSRPVCFDTPGYRHWFDGHAVFVTEAPREELTAELAEIFRHEPQPVLPAERAAVLERFDWRRIFARFWELVLDPSTDNLRA